MKNLYSIIAFLLMFNLSVIAQIKSNYERGFEIGFKEGYCYNTNDYNCFTPMVPFIPFPRLNESSDNQIQGYNRGFQYGLDLRRSNNALRNSDINLNQKIISFNQYVPQNPTEAMRVVGLIKQKKYNARAEWLQQKIYQFTNLYETLFNQQNFPENFQTYIYKNKLRDVMANYFDDIKAYDYGDDQVFQNIQQNLNNIEKYYYEYYNHVISQIKQKTEKEAVYTSKPNSNNYEEKAKNVNIKFSGILEKYYGKYNCSIEVYELVDNKYILKELNNGKIDLNNNTIKFSNKNIEGWRGFLNETLDNKSKEITYKTEYGNVVIDYEFRKITFYDLDNKKYYVYFIKNKI